MSEVNNIPENKETVQMADRVKASIERAKGYKGKLISFVKSRPVLSGAVGLALLAGTSYATFGGSSKIPVASANLPGEQASKIKSSGTIVTYEFVVGSFRKTDKVLILNNTKDYHQATQTIVVDLQACPELGAVSPRALIGRSIKAKGEHQTYEGKNQVKVMRSKDLVMDDTPATPTASSK